MSNEAFKKRFATLMAQAGKDAERVARTVALDLAGQMIEQSPVGDPTLWKSNADVTGARSAYLDAAIDSNAANPGRRKIATSKRALDKIFKLKAGGAYTGGRFKGNWQGGVGTINTATDSPPDANGGAALGRIKAVLATWKPGQTIYLTNSLSYARPLEYGHSKQAPGGVVRLTAQRYSEAVARAVREVKS